MSIDKSARRLRIRKGIRKKLRGTPERPRLSVFKSNRAIYAQIIDDIKGHTVTSISSFGRTGNSFLYTGSTFYFYYFYLFSSF